jgi:hypothetical protein
MRNPVMNNTKWDELRLAMCALDPTPAWSTLSTNGYQSSRDTEWFYHFRDGGYGDIAHVDIFATDEAMRQRVGDALRSIHVPGEETADGYRVFGYAPDGQFVDYL